MSSGSPYIHSSTAHAVRAELISGALTITALCVLGWLLWHQQAALLRFVYPAAALLIAGWLYISRPTLYLGFTWWIWFITPFMRRIIDYQAGLYESTNPVMVTPYLVLLLSLLSVLRFGRLLTRPIYVPFLLAILGVTYGYIIGVVKSGAYPATYGMLQWGLPVFLGFHAAVFVEEYPQHRWVVRNTFIWGILLMGIYGIFQYIVAPAWDVFWVLGSGMYSVGFPEPFGLRVFSTLNSTGSYSQIVMAGLLLLFEGKGITSRIAVVPGYISFMLTLARSAWLGWLVGLLALIAIFRGAIRRRLIITLIVASVLAVPLVLYSQAAESIRERVATFGSLSEDGSFIARRSTHERVLPQLLMNPVGAGLGSVGQALKLSNMDVAGFDSGVLEIPHVLGWPGALLYFGGLILLLQNIYRTRLWRNDRFAVVLLAGAIAQIFLMTSIMSLAEYGGCIAWTFLGLVVAAEAHYDLEGHGHPV